MPKLVRDFIPDLMKETGEHPKVRILHNDKEYLVALNAKVREELLEYEENHDLEELADLVEVIEALTEHVDRLSDGELSRVRARKRSTKGGFVTRQCLVSR